MARCGQRLNAPASLQKFTRDAAHSGIDNIDCLLSPPPERRCITQLTD